MAMAATSQSRNWDVAWTTSMDVHRKRITDNINNKNVALEVMRRSGRVEVDKGGRIIREDLMYGNGTETWFSGRQDINTAEPDGVTAAFFETRYCAVPIIISFTDEQESSTRDSAMNLLAVKTIQARNTLQNAINAQMWAATSGVKMNGFQDLIDSTPAVGTLGGINRANESWWSNIADTSSTPNWDNKSGDIYDGFTTLSTNYNSASDGNDEVSDLFMGLTLYGETQNIMESTGYARLTSGKGNAKIDAGKPAFRAATIHKDRDVPSGTVYGFNSDYYKLKIMFF
jgi:hypothetical protein